MTHVLGAGVLAVFLAVVLGGKFIGFLRERALGQNIREEGPAGHKTKQGTPTMGGLLIVGVTMAAFLLFSDGTAQALTVLFVTLACGLIGFVDDYSKIARKRSLGLSGRWKLALLVPIAAALGYVAHHEGLSEQVYLPVLDVHVNLGWLWFPFVYLVLAGATNAVNLTDGLDGLAAGTTTIAVLAYTAMCLIGYIVSVTHPREANTSRLDLAVDLTSSSVASRTTSGAVPATVSAVITGSPADGGGAPGGAGGGVKRSCEFM